MKNKVINLFGNNQMAQNKEVKYSKLLEQFMEPFAHQFEDIEYIEDIFELAINAWNFGNMKQILPEDENEDIADIIKEDGGVINIDLLNKMINYKLTNFKEYTNFIVDFELKEANAGKAPILSVITQEEDAYLANMVNEIEEDNQHSEVNYFENYINRGAIIVKPLQPFLDWLSMLNPEESFEKDSKETNIYLIDESIADIDKWLRKKFDKFFMMELDAWHTNKKEWPQKRNYKMFTQWFQVDVSISIYDLEKKPVLKSE